MVTRREHVVLQSAVHSRVADRASAQRGEEDTGEWGSHDPLLLLLSRRALNYTRLLVHVLLGAPAEA